MAQYEYEYGDHLAAQKMFQRYAEVFNQSEFSFCVLSSFDRQ